MIDPFLLFLKIENNAYSFGRTTIANLDAKWVILMPSPYHILSYLSKHYVDSFIFSAVAKSSVSFISPVIHYCGCIPPLPFSTCYWRCTAWDGTLPRCTTKKMTWLVAVLCTSLTHKGLNFVGNYCHVFLSMQVKRTLFVNGISKYAEESEIKQHFE